VSVVRVVARRREGFTHEVDINGSHTLVLDEPKEAGGADEGPSPTRTVAAALAACTAITMEMYAGRKEWDVGDVEVQVDVTYEKATPTAFDVTLRLPKELPSDQLDKLKVIAGKCPVHRLLASETTVSIEDRVEPV
jgi:putative redox protein